MDWLETCGHATVQVGLKRSTLVSEELEKAQHGNILSRTTLSLFYATDFADQLENIILPALKAGFIVLADRYIYTLMARDMVRGMDEAWLKNLYGIALEPDAVFYLSVEPEELVQRNLAKSATLDYWESGMDLGFSRDMFDSFLKYQTAMQAAFRQLQKSYGFDDLGRATAQWIPSPRNCGKKSARCSPENESDARRVRRHPRRHIYRRQNNLIGQILRPARRVFQQFFKRLQLLR